MRLLASMSVEGDKYRDLYCQDFNNSSFADFWSSKRHKNLKTSWISVLQNDVSQEICQDSLMINLIDTFLFNCTVE